METKMILVTGAAGKSGCAVLSALARRGVPTRALVRRVEQSSVVRALGVSDIVVGDMRREMVLREAVRDVRAIYHIGPNMNLHEVEMGQNAIAAARAAGVEHFVYHSVLHPQTEAMPHHWQKLRVEEALLQSGLNFTILQPTVYMQNIRGSWPMIQSEGIFRVPYPVSTRLSLVHLSDVAEVAAKVLLEAGHNGATYELVGTEPLSQVEVADVIGQVLERPVQAEEVTLDDWRREAEAANVPSFVVETLVKMFCYYAAYHFVGNTQVLCWLLGRAPAQLGDFIRELAGLRRN